MSIRFSRVAVMAASKAAVFLVGGIPSAQSDLDPWTAFRAFTEDLAVNERIAVNVETFEYGDGEAFDASPEEIAYIYMREERRPGFVEARTKKTGETSYIMSLHK